MSDGRGLAPPDGGGTSPWPLNRRDYVLRLRTHLPSTKEAINDAVRNVLKLARKCRFRDEGLTDLEIALREALANAVIHGNELGANKSVFVRCYAGPDTGLLVMVRDEGPGFDPHGVPDPRDDDRLHLNHGRGLFLMRALMDFIEYRKDGRECVLFKTPRAATSS